MTNGSPETKSKKDVAVYVDYENLYISLRSTVGQNPNFDIIMDKCREFGRLTICRAYADWSEFARVVTSQMFSSGVEPIFVPTRKFYDAKTRAQATKNSVDIVITIDIMKDVLQSKNIDIFVLVSGDRDFVPLMNQIRAAGKEVYAIGVAGCTSSELAVAVDEMFYYHQLLESEEDLAAEQKDVYAKLLRAVEIARARGYRATLGVVKPILRELVVGFDERKFRNGKGVPFQQFKQFVREAERQGFIRVAESGENFELFLATENIVERRPAKEQGGRPQRPQQQQQRGGGSQQQSAASQGDEEARREAPGETSGPTFGSSDADEPGEGQAAASGAEGEDAAERAGGRRRGRRGGRGRRRRGAGEGMAAGAEGGAEGGSELDADGEGDESSDESRAESHPGDDSGDDAAPDQVVSRDGAHRSARGGAGRSEPAARRDTGAPVHGEEADEAEAAVEPVEAPVAARERAPRRGRSGSGNGNGAEHAAAPAPRAAAAPAPAGDDEDGDADEEAALAALSDRTLPEDAMDDLASIMKTFSGRAPSQRRLIARLKKGATSGELRGDYREGQFLLMVRKALQEGYLEKVSKGFYAGLRWNDDKPGHVQA